MHGGNVDGAGHSMSEHTSTGPAADERVARQSRLRQAFVRPELGAMAGTILVFIYFAVVAGSTGMFAPDGIMNWGVVSAQFAIIAVGACLLMIAGEFDLSVGSMIGFAGIVIAILSVHLGWPMWAAILAAFAVAMLVGAANGYLVIRTGLPSFIVTLASLYIAWFFELLGMVSEPSVLDKLNKNDDHAVAAAAASAAASVVDSIASSAAAAVAGSSDGGGAVPVTQDAGGFSW